MRTKDVRQGLQLLHTQGLDGLPHLYKRLEKRGQAGGCQCQVRQSVRPGQSWHPGTGTLEEAGRAGTNEEIAPADYGCWLWTIRRRWRLEIEQSGDAMDRVVINRIRRDARAESRR